MAYGTSDIICFSIYVSVWWQDFTFVESVSLDGACFNVIAVSQCQNIMYILWITCPTTLCQFDMWQNVDASRSDVHPPAHWTECYRVVLHHVSLICGRMQYVPRSDVTLHPGNQIQSYRVLLHHVSLTCGRMQGYSGQMYIPLQIKPSTTELNYSMSVSYMW